MLAFQQLHAEVLPMETFHLLGLLLFATEATIPRTI